MSDHLSDHPARRRLWIALAFGFVCFVLAALASGPGIRAWEHYKGNRMLYRAHWPFPTDRASYRPGEIMAYRVKRDSDFDGLIRVNYALCRLARGEDGRTQIERWQDGAFERVISTGRSETITKFPLPAVLEPGIYKIFFVTRLRWRSYERTVTSETAPFRID